MPLKVLFVQHTGCAEQELPPAPITVIGEQVTPTRPVTEPTAMPRRPKRLLTVPEVADWTELQHCRLPVLHWLEGAAVVVTGGGVTVTVAVVVVGGGV